jgi:hypothetical protein
MQAPTKIQCSDCPLRFGAHTRDMPNRCRTCPFHLAAGFREDLGFVGLDTLKFVVASGVVLFGLTFFQPWIF